MNEWTTATALLAPVPSVHLTAARDEAMTSIVLGTWSTEVVEGFALSGGDGAPVLIYSSHEGGPLRLVVSWTGTFRGFRPAVGNGAVPREWRRNRPSSMRTEDRKAGSWAGYFLVADLLPVDEPWPISELSAGGDAPLSPVFVPIGPIVVER